MSSIQDLTKFEYLKIIWYFFRPYKLQLMFLSLVMFISGLLETLNLAALYPIINYGLEQKSQGIILTFFNKLLLLFGSNNLFLSSCFLLIIITVFATGFKALNYFFSYKLMVTSTGQYQKEILDKFIAADYDFYIKHQQGNLIHTGTIASEGVSKIILSAIRTVNDLITVVLLFSLLLMLTWLGTVIIVVVGLFYSFVVKRIMNKVIYRYGQLMVEENRNKNVILNEFITGIKTIKVFGKYRAWRAKYHGAVDKSMLYQFRMLMGRVLPESLMKIIFFFLLALIGIYINSKANGNMLPWLPVFGTFALVSSRLFPAIQIVGNDFMSLTASLPNTKIVYDLLHEDVKKVPEGSGVLKDFNKSICFENVWFKFNGTESYLFEGIHLSIESKKITAIVGESGNGKTTLINLLLRLYPLNKGKIMIDETDVSEYTYSSYLDKIGYVSQETFIFNDTIRENIRFGMEDCNENMIIEAAKEASAHAFIINNPNGYDTIVGDAGLKLSGGQRQRIAIARAMLRKPGIMVLDEATSSLDNIAEKKVQEAIDNISKHTTVIVIAHRLSTIQNADKIFVLEKGRVVEQGRHEALLNNKGAYSRLYTMQSAEN